MTFILLHQYQYSFPNRMSKAPIESVKYNIYAEIEVDGVVEKPDVIGAIFGQTEGLLGSDLDLRELQRSGRIGRIEVKLQTSEGKSKGTIKIPSSLDMVETAIVAAAIEQVDRVGPCTARVKVRELEDARSAKRKVIVKRASQLLREFVSEKLPNSEQLVEDVKRAALAAQLVEWKGLPAGQDVEKSDSVILVEGRADVLNLLRYDIRNVVAIEGTSIPPQIVELCKQKEVTAFVDGDRGGELILKELLQVADINYVARAPEGKEVEELTKQEVMLALKRRVLAEQFKQKFLREKLVGLLEEVEGKLVAKFYDKDLNQITELPIKDVIEVVRDVKPHCIVMDGIATQRLIDAAAESGVKYVVAVQARVANERGVEVLTKKIS